MRRGDSDAHNLLIRDQEESSMKLDPPVESDFSQPKNESSKIDDSL